VKHADASTLDGLAPWLEAIRLRAGPLRLQERKRGIWYRGGRAFLHFHADPTGPWADVRLGDRFERWPVRNDVEWAALLQRLDTLG